MTNKTLDDIKRYIITKLKQDCGYCGIAENEDFASINSDDGNGRDIQIVIKLKD